MKNYKVTVNGNTYEVGVEEIGGAAEVKTVRVAAPVPAPAPKAAPAPAPKAAPAPAPKAEAPKASASGTDVLAPLNGTIMSLSVAVGDKVKLGQTLLIFEAMKMENELAAPCDGTVAKINVDKGDAIETGMVVITIA